MSENTIKSITGKHHYLNIFNDLFYNLIDIKEVLGLWLGKTESSSILDDRTHGPTGQKGRRHANYLHRQP